MSYDYFWHGSSSFKKNSPRYQYILYKHLNKLFAFLVFSCLLVSHFCLISYICNMWYFKNVSINTRACLYALKCKFIVVLYFLFIWRFCSSLGLFQRYQKKYFLLSVLYTWMGDFSATLIAFDWTSCPTVSMATPTFCCTLELALYLAGSLL